MADNKGKGPEHDGFVSKVSKDPSKPADAILLSGFIGKSSDEGYTRIHFDPELKHYVDVPDEAILHSEKIPPQQSALGGSHVWIKSDAEIIHGPVGPGRVKAKFFEGPIAAGAVPALPPRPSLAPQGCPSPLPVCNTQLFVCPTHVFCTAPLTPACHSPLQLPTPCVPCPTPLCQTQQITPCHPCPTPLCQTQPITPCHPCPTPLCHTQQITACQPCPTHQPPCPISYYPQCLPSNHIPHCPTPNVVCGSPAPHCVEPNAPLAFSIVGPCAPTPQSYACPVTQYPQCGISNVPCPPSPPPLLCPVTHYPPCGVSHFPPCPPSPPPLLCPVTHDPACGISHLPPCPPTPPHLCPTPTILPTQVGCPPTAPHICPTPTVLPQCHTQIGCPPTPPHFCPTPTVLPACHTPLHGCPTPPVLCPAPTAFGCHTPLHGCPTPPAICPTPACPTPLCPSVHLPCVTGAACPQATPGCPVNPAGGEPGGPEGEGAAKPRPPAGKGGAGAD
jgi:hypothetical protein